MDSVKYSYNKYSIGVELTNPLKPNLHSNINTSNNYIGRSIWAYDQQNEPNSLLDGLIDDLKFYDRVLDNLEVVEDMSLIFGGVYFIFYFTQKHTYDPRRTSSRIKLDHREPNPRKVNLEE